MKLTSCLLGMCLGVSCALGAEFNVRDYGAKGVPPAGDGAAIQAAIDAAVHAGGGVVRFPAGDYYSGQLKLGSNLTLQLDEGAVLHASTRVQDYTDRHNGSLLTATQAEHLTVSGRGAVDGQTTADFGKRWGATEEAEFRTHLLNFRDCRQVAIRNVTFRNSDSWTVILHQCDQVEIAGVVIRNNYRRLNSDGIDPDSCTHVRISGCDIVTGDDSIVLKTGGKQPCEDIEVTDCTLESAATALKLGTGSVGDYRRIRFAHCRIRNSPVGLGLFMKDGGTMEQVTFADINLEACSAAIHDVVPIFIDIEKRHPDSKIGTVRDITFDHITITGGSGLLLQGMPESPLRNVVLRDITLAVATPDNYARRKKPVGGERTTKDERDTLYARQPTYAALAYIDGLTVENFRVNIGDEAFRRFPRSALAGFHLADGKIQGVIRTPETARLPVVELTDSPTVAVRP